MTSLKQHKSLISSLLPYVNQAWVSGVNFTSNILIARFLGIEGFGDYSLIMLLILGLTALQQAFIIQPFFQFISSKNSTSYLNSIQVVQLVFSLIGSALLTFIFKAFFTTELLVVDSRVLVIIATYTIGFSYYDFVRRTYYAMNKKHSITILDFVVYGVQLSGVVILGLFDLLSVEWILAIGSAAFGAVLLVETKRLIKSIPSIVELKQHIGDHWAYSKYLVFTALLQWFGGSYVIIAASSILGNTALGAIRMAQSLLGLVNVLFQVFENTVPVTLSSLLTKSGEKEMLSKFWKFLLKYSLPVLTFTGVIVLFQDLLIPSLYGESFIEFAYLLSLFGILNVFIYIGTFARFLIRTLSINQYIFWAYVISTAWSLGTSNYLIGTFGLSGVIGSLFIIQFIQLLVFAFGFKQTVKWERELSIS